MERQDYQVQMDRLLPYGFIRKDKQYEYRRPLIQDQLELVVEVNQNGTLSSYIWDYHMEEVYTAHLIEAYSGAFVNQVREIYQASMEGILSEIATFSPFVQNQTNRLAHVIKETWGDLPDYPFSKHPSFASFRHPDNQKWYGLIIQVRKSLIDGGENQEKVEILNLKADSKLISCLIKQPGIYPAYHMSKKSWVSLLLDETVSDRDVIKLIETSRQLVGPKVFKQGQGPHYWVLPANPKQYDIDADLIQNREIMWPQKPGIEKGDIVAIYMTAPIQAIRYICRVTETHLENAEDDLEKESQLMRLSLLSQVPDSLFTRKRMFDLGVKAVRGARRLTPEIVEALDQVLKGLGE